MSDVTLEKLGESIADSVGSSEGEVSSFCEAFTSILSSAMSAGKGVTLPGLGKFGPAGKDGKPKKGSTSIALMKDLCEKLSDSKKSSVQSILEGLTGAIQKEISEGRGVVLDSVGTFEVHVQPPQIEQQEKKGFRLVRPAMSRVRFLTPSGDGKLVFEAGDDLRKKVEANSGHSRGRH